MNEEYTNQLEASLTENLSRYSEHITRLEVHLSDENGDKESQDDKKCLIEARLKGRQPIAVTKSANTYDQAVDGATDKLKASLDTIIGKLRNH
jgi:ribosome-associated translation inhibitor RaiA